MRHLPRGGSQAAVARSEQAAVAFLVELAHGAARVHADPVRGTCCINVSQAMPSDPSASLAAKSAIWTARGWPRPGYSAFGSKPVGSCPAALTSSARVTGRRISASSDTSMRTRPATASLTLQPLRQATGQVPLRHDERNRPVSRRQASLAVPGDVARVEELGLEAAHQRVLEDVAALFARRSRPRCASGPARLRIVPAARVWFQHVDHGAPVAVVGRTPAGRIDAADARDDCQGLHDQGRPQERLLERNAFQSNRDATAPARASGLPMGPGVSSRRRSKDARAARMKGRAPMHASIRSLVATALAGGLVLLASHSITGCSGKKDEPQSAGSMSPAAPSVAESGPAVEPADEPLPPLPFETALPESVRAQIDQPFTGDLDEMVQRRLVRVGVTFNRTHLLRRPGRAAGRGLRVRQAHGGRAQQAAQDRQPEGQSSGSCRCRAIGCCRRSWTARWTW